MRFPWNYAQSDFFKDGNCSTVEYFMYVCKTKA